MSTLMPPKPPPPKPLAAPKPTVAATPTATFTISRGRVAGPQKILIYGTAGIGKSELVANLQSIGKRVIFIDVEGSTRNLDVDRIGEEQVPNFSSLQAAMRGDVLDGFDFVCLDSGTKAQDHDEKHVVQNFKTEKGKTVDTLGEFPFGKGLEHVYDTWLLLMQDFDWNIRQGRSVVVICHQCTEMVPNAAGEDYLQYQPRLQSPKSGKNSVRHKMIEWADHVFFIGYDKFVEDGKAKGSGTRAIYCAETPDCLAKSRTLPADQIPYEKGSADLWTRLFDSLKETK